MAQESRFKAKCGRNRRDFGGITSAGKNYCGFVRVTSKGQVTIPQWVREKYGFMPETDVEFVEHDGMVALTAGATASKPDRTDHLVNRLRGSAERAMTTDEILQLTRAYEDDE